eukprot:1848006-Alexandrium_andersonii.AAC.1
MSAAFRKPPAHINLEVNQARGQNLNHGLIMEGPGKPNSDVVHHELGEGLPVRMCPVPHVPGHATPSHKHVKLRVCRFPPVAEVNQRACRKGLRCPH